MIVTDVKKEITQDVTKEELATAIKKTVNQQRLIEVPQEMIKCLGTQEFSYQRLSIVNLAFSKPKDRKIEKRQ